MKSLRKFSMGVVAMAALLLTTGLAYAGSPSAAGTFTLPVEAHCRGAVLPVGNYTYSLQYSGGMAVLFLRAVEGKAGVFLPSVSLSSVSTYGKDELVLTKEGNEMIISSFTFRQFGLQMNYPAPMGAGLTVLASAKSK